METKKQTCLECSHVANVSTDSAMWACPECTRIQAVQHLTAKRGLGIVNHIIARSLAELHETEYCDRENTLRATLEIAWDVKPDVEMLAVWQELGD